MTNEQYASAITSIRLETMACEAANRLADDIYETSLALFEMGTHEQQMERAISEENRAALYDAIEDTLMELETEACDRELSDVLDSLDVILKPNGSFPHSTPAIPPYVQVLIDQALHFAEMANFASIDNDDKRAFSLIAVSFEYALSIPDAYIGEYERQRRALPPVYSD